MKVSSLLVTAGNTYISIGNIPGPTLEVPNRLGEGAGSAVIRQQARAEDPEGLDARVPGLGHGLDAAAGEPGRGDLGRVDGGVFARGARDLDGVVDRGFHHGRRGLSVPAASRSARGNDEIPV